MAVMYNIASRTRKNKRQVEKIKPEPSKANQTNMELTYKNSKKYGMILYSGCTSVRSFKALLIRG